MASRFGKTLRFPRATLQLPQKKPTSSGIFSCCFSRWSLRVFSYAREVFHSTYIHLVPAIMAVVWSGGPLTPGRLSTPRPVAPPTLVRPVRRGNSTCPKITVATRQRRYRSRSPCPRKATVRSGKQPSTISQQFMSNVMLKTNAFNELILAVSSLYSAV